MTRLTDEQQLARARRELKDMEEHLHAKKEFIAELERRIRNTFPPTKDASR
jgi:hypothetical protein